MRVTDQQMFAQQIQRIGRVREKQAGLQEQIASGQRVVRPSDDPGAFGRLARLETRQSALESFAQNAGVARSQLNLADDALLNVSDALSRVRELAVQGSNDTYNASDRQDIAQELRGLRDHVMSLSNTQYDGQYIFSGTRTDRPPLAQDGAYQGGGGGTVVKVGESAKVDIAMEGGAIFDADVNTIGTIDAIITSLEGNDPSALGDLFSDLDTAQQQVVRAQTSIGARLGRVEVAEQMRDEVLIHLQDESRDLGESDVADVVSKLVAQERALQAAVQMSQRAQQPGLLSIL